MQSSETTDSTAPRGTATDRCRVCGNSSDLIFNLVVLGNSIGYFDCKFCGYLQTERPYWLERAYAVPINIFDTGILLRNGQNIGRVIMTLLSYGNLRGKVVDHAGGYGILVRLLRDAGIQAEWSDKYCENILARGFEATREKCDLLTAFEVLEHMVDPVSEIERMLDDAKTVLLSTELIPTSVAPSKNWWYLAPEHGQHIGFFRRATLTTIAAKLGCYCESYGYSIHIFSRRRIPRSWHALQRLSRFWPLLRPIMPDSKTQSDSIALRQH